VRKYRKHKQMMKKKEKKKERGWGEGVEGIKRPGSCTT
jgi:hypothetical protein